MKKSTKKNKANKNKLDSGEKKKYLCNNSLYGADCYGISYCERYVDENTRILECQHKDINVCEIHKNVLLCGCCDAFNAINDEDKKCPFCFSK